MSNIRGGEGARRSWGGGGGVCHETCIYRVHLRVISVHGYVWREGGHVRALAHIICQSTCLITMIECDGQGTCRSHLSVSVPEETHLPE